MSDFPFSIPRRGDGDVVNGVSYAGDTLTLTRAEGSDLTTTIATSDPTKIENGTSSMEIDTADGACVFTPNGDTALTTTFAADGNVGINDTSPTGGKLCVNGTTYLNGDSSSTGGVRITRNTYATPGSREWLISNHISSGVGTSHLFFRAVTNDTIATDNINFSGAGDIEATGNITLTGSSPQIVNTSGFLDVQSEYNIEFLTDTNGNNGGAEYKFKARRSDGATPVTILSLSGATGDGVFSGNVTAAGVVLSSDDRIKENEKLIVNATETLSKLTPQIYDKYITMDLSGSFLIESGLIAQELYYNAPELRHLVTLGKDTDASGNEYTPTPEEMDLSDVDIGSDPDYGSHGWSKTQHSSLDYNGLIAYLIKSNQEMAERLAALENK